MGVGIDGLAMVATACAVISINGSFQFLTRYLELLKRLT